MDNVKALDETVAQTIAGYACDSPNSTMYHVHDAHNRIDSVIVVPFKRENKPHIVVMTRLVGDQVVIEVDTTDHPVEDDLMAYGIPRSQIVIAWRGEKPSGDA